MSTSDVDDRAARAADELRLAGAGAGSASRAHPAGRARVVVLDEVGRDAEPLAERSLAERLGEEAARVAEDLRLQQQCPAEAGG